MCAKLQTLQFDTFRHNNTYNKKISHSRIICLNNSLMMANKKFKKSTGNKRRTGVCQWQAQPDKQCCYKGDDESRRRHSTSFNIRIADRVTTAIEVIYIVQWSLQFKMVAPANLVQYTWHCTLTSLLPSVRLSDYQLFNYRIRLWL